jgi:ParB family chromosome partitioning protein
VGVDRSTVANHLRLLELPRELQADVEGGALSAGHAKALLQVASPERRRQLRDRILADGLSVRAAEELARVFGGAAAPARRKSPRPAVVDPDLEQLIGRLRDRLQTRVRVTGDPRRGKLEIDYYGAEELHRLARLILDGDAR